MKISPARKRVATILLFIGPTTTLIVSPSASFDPINLIKLVAVTSLSFAVLGLLSFMRENVTRLPTVFKVSCVFFVAWMLVVVAMSGAPIHQQIWGQFGRNTGLVTYSSLIIVVVAVASVQYETFYKKLVETLVLTSIPTTIYALIQIAGRDPVSWSVMAPFATLGNVNFSSAFFGLASVCATILILVPRQSPALRILLAFLVITNLWIILQTGSIQGLMIYIAGIGVAGLFVIRATKVLAWLQIPYVFLGLAGFLATSLALKNLGPLARFVFGETILFRFDYWYAGWVMTLKNPLFGVGLDSYADWYRQLRGEVATLRTVPDRITNTAHNIYLDISSTGGFPLLFAYLVILAWSMLAAIRVLRRSKSFQPHFVAIFAAWIAYLIQAAISINQVGVGIWGWLFSGALIGYEIATREEQDSKKISASRKFTEVSQLPAKAALVGIFGFIVGFGLSFIPFHADSQFKNALQSGDVRKLSDSSQALGATSFHMELALDSALKANDVDATERIVRDIIARYPRDFMAWRVRQVLVTATEAEREEAYRILRDMDPYNPEIRRVQ